MTTLAQYRQMIRTALLESADDGDAAKATARAFAVDGGRVLSSKAVQAARAVAGRKREAKVLERKAMPQQTKIVPR